MSTDHRLASSPTNLDSKYITSPLELTKVSSNSRRSPMQLFPASGPRQLGSTVVATSNSGHYKSFQPLSRILQQSTASTEIMQLNYRPESETKSTVPVPAPTERPVVSTGSILVNNNEVRNVMLYGVPIVSLVMDGQERLCLAQISNTLLKNFSYNEIHNRRVALGITCIQCTPVQLELLRRAGAMPVSSRRCGMITKREAERLCKSFLAETSPPKLPESFAFDVYHACAWGCRGNFTPSRAKCIKCIYCGLFFSPNKFIFHSHRLPNSKYIQPDAANFNSWRRHIRLVGNPDPPEHVIFAWEDVKAMFNGGSRKRAMSSTMNSYTKNQEQMHSERMVQNANAKFKYGDESSAGIDDSDECSVDTGRHIDVGTNEPASEPPESESGHFAQVSQKNLLEGHFKKSFETDSKVAPIVSSPPLSPHSSALTPPLCATTAVDLGFHHKPDLHSFATKDFLDKSKPEPLAHYPTVSDLGGNYTLFSGSGSNFLLNRHQINSPTNTSPAAAPRTHPAILNSLLTAVPSEGSHFRSPVLSPGYVPLPPNTGQLSPTHLATAPANSVPVTNSADFRNNLAEFMWSMASKATPPSLHYNFLWQSSGGVPPSLGTGSGPTCLDPAVPPPIPVSHSSSSSSTPNVSPTTHCETTPDPNGLGFFPFKRAVGTGLVGSSSEELRKALLMHHQQIQQRNPSLAHFPQVTPGHNGLIPNLLGTNLRLMPGQSGSQGYFRDYSESVADSQKSPEMLNNTLFPFYPTSGANMDRFSTEMIAARNQLLFDAYSVANQGHIFQPRSSLFHSSLFVETSHSKSFEPVEEGDKSVDVIGDDDSEMSLKSVYPLTYSRNNPALVKKKKRSMESDGKEACKIRKGNNGKKSKLSKKNSLVVNSDAVDAERRIEAIMNVNRKENSEEAGNSEELVPVEHGQGESSAKTDTISSEQELSQLAHSPNQSSSSKMFMLINETNQNNSIKLIS